MPSTFRLAVTTHGTLKRVRGCRPQDVHRIKMDRENFPDASCAHLQSPEASKQLERGRVGFRV